ncbi:MAG: ABC transporter substrate-binding protein [Acidimicrobiales bacterium]
MSKLILPKSPSPSKVGMPIGRRGFIKGAAGAAGAVSVGGLLAACGSDDATTDAGSDTAGLTLGEASGDLTIGSNYSNELPQAGLAAAVAAVPNENINGLINEVDHNTFQENIQTYLQQPDDIIPWFAGYRMRFFAEQDLLGDISDVWGQIGSEQSDGFKQASTGDDGNQYFVPWAYYAWGIYYRKSLFADNGYEIPTDLAGLTSLGEAMAADGITPFAFANGGNWPAMGTFDQINFRLHGYQFHVDLMAGKEPWNGDKVKETFNTFAELLPLHQENPNGREWEEAAAAIVNKEAGMMTIGTFIGSQFPEEDFDDIDFFPFPALSDEHGIDTIEAPIDGWMMAKAPKNEAAAKEMLAHFGTGVAQDAYLAEDPSVVATSSSADTSVYNDLQRKVQAAVASAKSVTQFLDRDTSPEFASNVAGPRIADFLADPTKLDSILDDMEEQAEVILRG